MYAPHLVPTVCQERITMAQTAAMSANKTPFTLKQPSYLLLHSTTQSCQCYKFSLLYSTFTHASNRLKLLESLGTKYIGLAFELILVAIDDLWACSLATILACLS